MSDLIDRAREQWCEQRNEYILDSTVVLNYGPKRCPPEVVSALLDVLDKGCDCPACSIDRDDDHTDYCNIRVAEATIARALEEQKP